MNRLKFSISIVILSILLLNENVIGFSLKNRAKRMTNSSSDFSNFFKHDIFLITESGTCSGSIISDRFVLTAAHCVMVKGTEEFTGIDNQTMKVVAGITELFNVSEFHVIRLVKKIYVPRDFDYRFHADNHIEKRNGDIAVLELNYRLGLDRDPRLDIIKLPTHEFKIGEKNAKQSVFFTGYGLINASYDETTGNYLPGILPSHLKFSQAIVLQPSECYYLGDPTLKMCAQLETEGSGICGGDSGGSLFDFDENAIIGVLSYGDVFKCNGSVPGKYTKVFPFVEFIMNAINNIPDDRMRVKSFEGNDRYENELRTYPWNYLYSWIYDPDNH